MLTLGMILDHVGGDRRAALRRLHALREYHQKAGVKAREQFDNEQVSAHTAKSLHYETLINELEETR